jgi:hypothetical protein
VSFTQPKRGGKKKGKKIGKRKTEKEKYVAQSGTGTSCKPCYWFSMPNSLIRKVAFNRDGESKYIT